MDTTNQGLACNYEYYIHNKTGNLYAVNPKGAMNATNGHEDRPAMVLYKNTDNQIFVREAEEFYEKFTKATDQKLSKTLFHGIS